MSLDHATLEILRHQHPAWKLLRAEHAPLIGSFLQRVFVLPNVRSIAQANLAEALEDELYSLRELFGENKYPKPALDYLNEWASTDKMWLRKYYAQGTDEPHFDLTPATEKAIAWLDALTERSFVGTESRLLTIFELLRQMSEGTKTDPEVRLVDLQRRRDEIDLEMTQVRKGNLPILDDTAVKDRFQQFVQIARELLADFRQVEGNFRQLDRQVRERIALWDGRKGALLQEIMGERDAIADSDQGKSFRAFWDFLMSSQRQEELTGLLEHVLELAPVQALKPDTRTKRIHYDWLEAGEHTQRTVAQLSQQLRRFLDDQAWLENRRIMDILRSIETRALGLRSEIVPNGIMSIADTAAEFDLPMERPLFTPSRKSLIVDMNLSDADEDIDAASLYAQIVIDKALLVRHIEHCLQDRQEVALTELVERKPLAHGLAELVAYLQLGSDQFNARVDEDVFEKIFWQALNRQGQSVAMHAQLPQVVFIR
jgi:Protein of unknown function (DUF3375)